MHVCGRKKELVEGGCYWQAGREGPVKSKEKGLVTLQGLSIVLQKNNNGTI